MEQHSNNHWRFALLVLPTSSQCTIVRAMPGRFMTLFCAIFSRHLLPFDGSSRLFVALSVVCWGGQTYQHENIVTVVCWCALECLCRQACKDRTKMFRGAEQQTTNDFIASPTPKTASTFEQTILGFSSSLADSRLNN